MLRRASNVSTRMGKGTPSFASYTGALEMLDARQQQILLWVIC